MKKMIINATYRNLSIPKKVNIMNYCFFDFECTQEKGIHKPNLCIIHNEAGDEWLFPRGEHEC